MANTDTWAFFALIVFFLSLGLLLPFVQDAFGEDTLNQDLQNIVLNEDDVGYDPIGMFDVLLSVITIFFWSFGQVYWVVDLLILFPLRILAFYLLLRMVRGI